MTQTIDKKDEKQSIDRKYIPVDDEKHVTVSYLSVSYCIETSIIYTQILPITLAKWSVQTTNKSKGWNSAWIKEDYEASCKFLIKDIKPLTVWNPEESTPDRKVFVSQEVPEHVAKSFIEYQKKETPYRVYYYTPTNLQNK